MDHYISFCFGDWKKVGCEVSGWNGGEFEVWDVLFAVGDSDVR
jgi:hypothetical protein